MSGRRLDPFRFAAEGRRAQGEFALSALPRLADLLAVPAGAAQWKLAGAMVRTVLAEAGGAMEPRLELDVSTTLVLRCQRCLEALDWPLELHAALWPVRAGQPIADEELDNDDFDAIEVDGELDVGELVEDEILLALPIAPRHENCASSLNGNGANKESPFAALASLRGGGRAD